MNIGQRVQIRRCDGVDHWIFAVIEDAATNRVRITHPGNVEHGNAFIAAPADIRTKADVQSILATVQATVRGRLSDAQIRQLAQSDGWLLHYLRPDQSIARESLHKVIVEHYQNILKSLD